jgi:hypothetical protein
MQFDRCWGLSTVESSWTVWLVVLIALCAANLPFLSQRLLGLFLLPSGKGLGLRFFELLVCYFLVGGIGLMFESRAGQIAPQTWEFYAITVFLFLTLAFPGFVYRYLVMRRS